MNKLIKFAGCASLRGLVCLFCACMLCGCTKKEQLLLERSFLEEGLETDTIRQSGETEGYGKPDERPYGEEAVSSPDKGVNETAGSSLEEIYVHICGAVNAPGVFALPEGSRVFDAVEAAGGFAEDASPDHINQAQIITDGCKIRIPTVEEAEAFAKVQEDPNDVGFLIEDAQNDGHAEAAADGKVNINTADVPQLCTINGIGEGRAAAIIKYREANGGFKSIEEIMNVAGIKQGVFDKIKDQIRVK